MAISSIRELKAAERNYTSTLAYLRHAPFLCKSSSVEEFKKEMLEYAKGMDVPLTYLVSGTDEQDPEKSPLSVEMCLGNDGPEKLDWFLSQVPKDFHFGFFLSLVNPYSEKTLGYHIAKDHHLKEILEKHNGIIQSTEAYGVIQDRFSFEGFTIVNTDIPKEELEELLDKMRPLFKKMRSLGFGNVLYGTMLILGGTFEGYTIFNTLEQRYETVSASALYSYTKDMLTVNAHTKYPEYMDSYIAHELGHRHYYKILSISQRQQWKAHFVDRGKYVTDKDVEAIYEMMSKCATKHEDSMGFEYVCWDLFDWGKFTVAINKYTHLKEVLDFMVLQVEEYKSLNIKTARRKFILDRLLYQGARGGPTWDAKHIPDFASRFVSEGWNKKITKEELDSPEYYKQLDFSQLPQHIGNYIYSRHDLQEVLPHMLRMYSNRMFKAPKSTSEYGRNNESEDYAEAFKAYVMNYEVPTDIAKEFIRINRLRMGSKKTAGENTRGEFWIIGGQATSADGDIGDVNHEGMVRDHILAELTELVNDETGSRINPDSVDWLKLEYTIIEHLDKVNDPDDMTIPKPSHEDADNFILEELGFEKDKLEVVKGNIEARLYGLQHLGWKRVVDTHVQSWSMSNNDLSDISSGLEDAYPDAEPDELFELESLSNSKLYVDVPLSVIDERNASGLLVYQYRYIGSRNKKNTLK